MKKGIVAGCLLVLLSGVPAVFAADNCLAEPQNLGEYQQHKSKTAYLGVDVSDVDSDRVAALHLKEETGVEVLGVDQDAPAGKAGIKEHDVILAVSGTKIESEEELRRVIRETPPGRTIDVLISRNGQQMTLKPTLAARNQMVSVWVAPQIDMPEVHVEPPHIPPMPPMNFAEAPDVPDVRVYYSLRSVGALVENLTPQLRDFFGVKSGAGILVRSVERGSPAETAGLKAGDVIVRVGQDSVNDSGDWRRAMRNKSGDVSVGIVRDKHEQSITMKLPAPKQSGELWDSEEFDFDFQPQMDALRKELKDLPKITEQQKIAMLKAQEQWKKSFEANKEGWQKSLDEARKESERARVEQQKAMKDLQRNLEKMQEDLQKQFHYISYE